MTLEWLLIVAAIAALGASSVLVVQRVLDATADAPTSPEVLLIEADIAAARITSDFALAGALDRAPFEARCTAIAADFAAVVALAEWRGVQSDNPATPENEYRPERCHLDHRPQ